MYIQGVLFKEAMVLAHSLKKQSVHHGGKLCQCKQPQPWQQGPLGGSCDITATEEVQRDKC